MTKTYTSKISYGLLITLFILFFAPLIPITYNEGINNNIVFPLLFLVLVFAFILHMFLKTEYKIEDSILKIRCGFITYKPIDIKTIKEITKSNSLVSSPAASFDRIEIKYGKFDEILISPKDKLEFVKHLKAINPNIKNHIKNN